MSAATREMLERHSALLDRVTELERALERIIIFVGDDWSTKESPRDYVIETAREALDA